jgi:type IV pilus assembly protein PilN
MITINLLPVREERRKQELRGHAGLVIVCIAIACFCVTTVQANLVRKVNAGAREVERLKVEKEQYKDQLAEVDKFKAQKEDIEKKLGVIGDLNASRSGPVRILDELGSRTPNNVYIQSLLTESGFIELKGEGLNNEVIAEYLDLLEESEYFGDVKLETIKRKKVQGLKVSSFEIRAQLITPGEEESDESKEEGTDVKSAKANATNDKVSG